MNKSESGFPWWMKMFTVIICLCLFFVLWLNYINTTPDIKTPITKMPDPNAYDYFVAAANSVADTDIIDAADSKIPMMPVINSKPAVPNKAIKKNPKLPFGGMPPPTYSYRFPTEAEKIKALKNNSEVLDYFRAGLKYECKTPQRNTISDATPYISGFRRLAHLLLIESKFYESKKNWNSAIQSRMDGIEFGVKTADGGSFATAYFGTLIEAISRKNINIIASNLLVTESKNAVKRLENILNNRIPLINTIKEEKNIMIRSYTEIFRKPRWQNEIIETLMLNDKDSNYQAFIIRAKMTLYGKRFLINGMISNFDKYIETLKKPYTAKTPTSTVSDNPINQITFSEITQNNYLRFSYEKNRTLDYILLLELALRAYKLENRTYPEKLENLVPKYLTKLPDDPFTQNGTFKYEKKNNKYLLYSLGPDCKDDSGKPIVYSSNAKVFIINSKGDIVAGVNYK